MVVVAVGSGVAGWMATLDTAAIPATSRTIAAPSPPRMKLRLELELESDGCGPVLPWSRFSSDDTNHAPQSVSEYLELGYFTLLVFPGTA